MPLKRLYIVLREASLFIGWRTGNNGGTPEGGVKKFWTYPEGGLKNFDASLRGEQFWTGNCFGFLRG